MTEAAAPQTPPQLGINVQYIKDFSFESPNAPQIFAPTTVTPDLNLGVNIQSRPVGENAYEVVLMLRLESTIDKKPAFIAELAYAGIFTVEPCPEDILKFLLMAEAPRYLFPFARSILASVMRDGGFPQILVNPIDFRSEEHTSELQSQR